MKEFRGKVAVVTGGASGIGLALGKRAAGEGMKVVLADIEEVALGHAVAEIKAHGAVEVPAKLVVLYRRHYAQQPGVFKEIISKMLRIQQ